MHCPACGAALPGHGPGRCLSTGRVLALIGGLALIAAYFMPWFGTQGIILTGSFLSQFLGNARDLRQFLPGSSGGAAEVQLLRGLVYFFPVCGGLAAVLTVAGWVWPRLRRVTHWLLAILGLVVLIALIVGQGRLPETASREVGLWTIGLGALAILIGAAFDLSRRLVAPVATESRAQVWRRPD